MSVNITIFNGLENYHGRLFLAISVKPFKV